MFKINREGRFLLQNNFETVQNEFDNDGLITYEIDLRYYESIMLFEKILLKTMRKKIENRKLSIELSLIELTLSPIYLSIFNEGLRSIKEN